MYASVVVRRRRPLLSARLPDGARRLLADCLRLEPAQRPTAAEALARLDDLLAQPQPPLGSPARALSHPPASPACAPAQSRRPSSSSSPLPISPEIATPDARAAGDPSFPVVAPAAQASDAGSRSGEPPGGAAGTQLRALRSLRSLAANTATHVGIVGTPGCLRRVLAGLAPAGGASCECAAAVLFQLLSGPLRARVVEAVPGVIAGLLPLLGRGGLARDVAAAAIGCVATDTVALGHLAAAPGAMDQLIAILRDAADDETALVTALHLLAGVAAPAAPARVEDAAPPLVALLCHADGEVALLSLRVVARVVGIFGGDAGGCGHSIDGARAHIATEAGCLEALVAALLFYPSHSTEPLSLALCILSALCSVAPDALRHAVRAGVAAQAGALERLGDLLLLGGGAIPPLVSNLLLLLAGGDAFACGQEAPSYGPLRDRLAACAPLVAGVVGRLRAGEYRSAEPALLLLVVLLEADSSGGGARRSRLAAAPGLADALAGLLHGAASGGLAQRALQCLPAATPAGAGLPRPADRDGGGGEPPRAARWRCLACLA